MVSSKSLTSAYFLIVVLVGIGLVIVTRASADSYFHCVFFPNGNSPKVLLFNRPTLLGWVRHVSADFSPALWFLVLLARDGRPDRAAWVAIAAYTLIIGGLALISVQLTGCEAGEDHLLKHPIPFLIALACAAAAYFLQLRKPHCK
jgi:hypothetical protein